MEISVLGIDLAKEVFHVHGVDSQHRVVLRKRIRRAQVLAFVRNLNSKAEYMSAIRIKSDIRERTPLHHGRVHI